MASQLFLEWYQAHNENTDDDIAAWSQPWDTLVQTRFGGGASTSDVLSGNADRSVLASQLADGVMDDDNRTPRISTEELDELGRGVLHSAGQWQEIIEPYPELNTVRSTARCVWTSPYVPAFRAQLIVDEEFADDATKWRCTAVLGPSGEVEEMTAAYDASAGVLTLTSQDDACYLVETFVDSETCLFTELLRRGDAAQVMNAIAERVKAGAANPSILSSKAPLTHKLAFLKRLQLRDYLRHRHTHWHERVQSLVDEFDPSSHHHRFQLQRALDHVGNLGSLDAHALLSTPLEFVSVNSRGTRPRCGGRRAAFLASQGWLDADDFNDSPSAEKLDEAHREYASWKLNQLRQNNITDKNRWRVLTRQVDALTRMCRDHKDRPIPEDVPDDDQSTAAHADAELQPDVVSTGGDLPTQLGDEEDDERVLEQTLKEDPKKVPALLRGVVGVTDDEPQLIAAVDETEAVRQRNAYKQAATSARVRKHGRRR